MIQVKSVEEARRQVDKAVKNKEKPVILGRDIEFNRKILEMKKVNMLILNHKEGKDKLKERDSGLNQVLCKIARDNNITLAIDFHELQVEDKKTRAKIMSRIIQNIKLMKKFKNNLVILNKPEDKLSLAAFLRVLGSSSELAKKISQ